MVFDTAWYLSLTDWSTSIDCLQGVCPICMLYVFVCFFRCMFVWWMYLRCFTSQYLGLLCVQKNLLKRMMHDTIRGLFDVNLYDVYLIRCRSTCMCVTKCSCAVNCYNMKEVLDEITTDKTISTNAYFLKCLQIKLQSWWWRNAESFSKSLFYFESGIYF